MNRQAAGNNTITLAAETIVNYSEAQVLVNHSIPADSPRLGRIPSHNSILHLIVLDFITV